MKQVYSRKSFAFLAVIALLLIGSTVRAQNPTSWTVSSDCNFTIDFNINDGGFSSPSIYSGDDDFEMLYDYTNGWWEETSGRIAGVGETSIISPFFINPADNTTVVGFYYEAPPGSQYRVRVVTVSSLDPNHEIVANTGNGPLWNPLPSTAGVICLRIDDLDINAGQPLRYEVSFRAFVAGDIIFDDFQLEIEQSPLPVTFMGFVAKKEPTGGVKLLWNVADEVNVSHYDVERSQDGVNFTKVGEVDAQEKSVYSHIDASPNKGVYYYRVRNVDLDGAYKYTGIVRVSFSSQSDKIKLYPVPAGDYVYLQHEKAPARGIVKLMTIDGRILQRIQTVPNSMQTNIITTNLKPGLYIVQYENGDGMVETIKMVKQ